MRLFKNHEVDYIHNENENLFEKNSNIDKPLEKRVKILPNMTDRLKNSIGKIDDLKFNSDISEGFVVWIEYKGSIMELEFNHNKEKNEPIIRKVIKIMKTNRRDVVGPIGFDPKKGECLTQMY